VQTDATFCGQCGFNLRSTTATATEPTIGTDFASTMPDLVSPNQSVQPEPVVLKSSSPDLTPVPATTVSHPVVEPNSGGASVPPPPPTITIAPETEQFSPPPPPQQSHPTVAASTTQLQQQTAQLLHVQTDALIELPQNLSVIHIGKQNDRIQQILMFQDFRIRRLSRGFMPIFEWRQMLTILKMWGVLMAHTLTISRFLLVTGTAYERAIAYPSVRKPGNVPVSSFLVAYQKIGLKTLPNRRDFIFLTELDNTKIKVVFLFYWQGYLTTIKT
jgi:hypothetical protein